MEFNYTLEDFSTPTPYEDILKINDPFQQDLAFAELCKYASKVNFKGIKKLFQSYKKSRVQAVRAMSSNEQFTEFEHGEVELYTGEWIANDYGVYRTTSLGREYACSHPIQPVERLKNIDTGELKVKIQWRRGVGERRIWNSVVVDLSVISSAKDIVSLSRLGISVQTGKRAQNLVDYLTETLDRNYDEIPETKSVSRLGWNEEGFSPYIGELVFDGNENFGRTFASIRQFGSFDDWKSEVCNVRRYSLTARIILAASFASVLVEKMGCLPFFVHMWGMASGTGKTLAQMVAASVWGEPSPGGEYFKTFKSTTVGFEVFAGMLNSLPLIIDELQLAKDARGKVIFNVYELSSGSGKMRSNVKLGVSATPRWSNCFITSGETPVTSEQDGAGALNRVIEVECIAENKVIEDGYRTAEIMKKNYGHAGKYFIEKLCEESTLEIAKERYNQLYLEFTGTKATEKQAHSAALITLADELATQWIFDDGMNITVTELSGFLKSKEAVSAAERGYSYMCDWVTLNSNKFIKEGMETGKNDVYGKFPGNQDPLEERDRCVYIIRSVFNKACTDAGISPPALLSNLRSKGLIITKAKGYTKSKRIGGIPTDCVIMYLKNDESGHEYVQNGEKPF